jgi:hypothetical protein
VGRTAPIFVAWSLGICALCAVAYCLAFPAPTTGLTTPWLAGWLLERMPRWGYNLLVRGLFSVALIGFLAAMTVALVAGPRALRAGRARRGALLCVCGLLLAAVYCGGPMLWYARSRHAMDEMRAAARARMAELRAHLESGRVEGAQRDTMWQFYARGLYRDEGIAAEIPDANGRLISYQPSEADVAARASYVRMLEGLQSPTGHLMGSAAWTALCLAVGMLTPLRFPWVRRKTGTAAGREE